jgi:hypothetical protein
MPQATSLKIHGVATHKNRLGEVKEGALARASNIIIDRESIAEPRRGFGYYGSSSAIASASTGSIKSLYAYDGRLIALFNGSFYLDNGSGTSWTKYATYDGTVTNPTVSGGSKPKSAQALGNLYVTTGLGVLKLDDRGNDFIAAGMQQPLDGTASTTGSSGFLANNFDAGYRAVLYRIDDNDNRNEVVSAVSDTLLLQNTSGGSRNGTIRFYLPEEAVAGNYYRVYRSEQVATGTPPSDELQQVAEAELTSTDISNGYFQFTDSTTDNLRGAKLYTSPSEPNGGIANNNDLPPLAGDICFYRGHMLYFNLISRHTFYLSLLGAGDTAIRYYVDASVGTTNGSGVLTGIASTSTLRVGMRAKGTGLPANARIASVDGANQVTVSPVATATGTVSVEFGDILRIDGVEYFAASATVAASKEFAVYTSGTASQNIETTARNIVRVVNANASADVYGRYISGFDDTPGQMLFRERSIGGTEFQVSTTATEAFAPALPTTDDGSQLSLADVRPSFCIPSKPEEPEAVPLGGGFRCGETPIRRALALRDAVVVLSDTVGIITGLDRDTFRYEALDNTTKLVGPETAVVLNDAVYCMSTQGVVRITTSGVQIASRDIEKDLIQAGSLSVFEAQAFGVAYESDRAYWLFVPTSASDTWPEMYWRYGAFTESWTHGEYEATCGIVNPVDGKLYLGHADNTVRQERKSYDRTDYADTSFAVTISGAGSAQTQLTLSSTTGIAAGDLLVQSTREIRVLTVDSGTTITMESSDTWSNGAATIYKPITCIVETLPFAGGNAGMMKQFTEATFLFRDAQFDDFLCSVANNFFPDMGTYQLELETDDMSSTWGVQPTGSDVADEQGVRTLIPSDVSRALWLRVRLTFSICRETMAMAGISAKFREYSSRFIGGDR